MALSRKKRELYRQLAIMRFHRRTLQECANHLGVSLRTINNWVATPEFKKISAEVQAEWRDMAHGQIAELGQQVIENLVDLMEHARSEFVRFHAAAKLGDWFRLGQPDPTDEVKDDRVELLELTKRLAERATQLPPSQFQVLPGGLLPSNQAVLAQEPDVVEGEVIEEEDGKERAQANP